MADPLSLLREFVSSGKIDEVVLSGDRVDFGGKFTFSKNVATGYKSQQVRGQAHIGAHTRSEDSRQQRAPQRGTGWQARRPPPFAANPPPARASLPARLQGKGNFYDLETLLFFAKHVDVKFAEYFKKASKEFGAGKQVTFVDRKVGVPGGLGAMAGLPVVLQLQQLVPASWPSWCHPPHKCCCWCCCCCCC
jgi:hypothetical protein